MTLLTIDRFLLSNEVPTRTVASPLEREKDYHINLKENSEFYYRPDEMVSADKYHLF